MTEVKKCKLPDCTYSVFEDSEWCILHCTKDHWKEENKGKTKWDMLLVNQFWGKFKEHVVFNANCKYFIFPLELFEDNKSIFSNSIKSGLKFSSSKFLSSIQIRGKSFSNVNFSCCNFNYLHISSCNIINSSFYLLNNNKITFEFCEITKCDFSNHRESSMIFDSCEKIVNCKFIDSDFKYLKFGTSNISNSVFYGTKVKKGCVNTFRIIKQFHSNLSDNFNLSIFHAKELRAFMNDIFKAPRHIIKLVTDGSILLWNYIVSNFGQNWILPLFWFFISSICFYYIIDVGGSRSLDEFSMFINPFLKNIDEKYKGFYTLWLIHKILSIIFIYHFIVAVKRKTKK